MTISLIIDPLKIANDVTAIASKVIRKITYDVAGAIVDQIRKGPKTGRLYKRGKRGRVHRASALGETPASDSGHLINSVQVSPFTNPLVGEVIVAADYAVYLERGTRHMSPRPYIKPAIEGVISKLQSATRVIS
jgi:HK97 gp10 family phage protein